MPRLVPIDPKTASGKTKAQLDSVVAALGTAPNMMRAMAQSPALLEGYLAFSKALAGGTLDPKLREAIALAVAEANACAYCLSAHAHLGRRTGLTPEAIDAARAARSADARHAAALRFVKTLVARRGALSDADLGELRRAGFDEGATAEIVGHVALNVLTNYFNNVALPDIDFPSVAPGKAA